MPEGTAQTCRFAHGRFDITVLSDGFITLPAEVILPDAPPDDRPRGHTPGHVSFELKGGDGLVIAGDVVPSNIVFFEHPGWHFGFDTESEIALKSRQVFLDRAASERFEILGCHWVYPGVGRAERKDGAYRFIPARASPASHGGG